jgi:hypothetical protein
MNSNPCSCGRLLLLTPSFSWGAVRWTDSNRFIQRFSRRKSGVPGGVCELAHPDTAPERNREGERNAAFMRQMAAVNHALPDESGVPGQRPDAPVRIPESKTHFPRELFPPNLDP